MLCITYHQGRTLICKGIESKQLVATSKSKSERCVHQSAILSAHSAVLTIRYDVCVEHHARTQQGSYGVAHVVATVCESNRAAGEDLT